MVQHTLEHGSPLQKQQLCEAMQSEIGRLARHKARRLFFWLALAGGVLLNRGEVEADFSSFFLVSWLSVAFLDLFHPDELHGCFCLKNFSMIFLGLSAPFFLQVASHVVECALLHSSSEARQMLKDAMASNAEEPGSLGHG